MATLFNVGFAGVLDTKAPYMCSAEMNAILNKNAASVKGCAIYVALFPDNEAAKLIIQAGIKEVVCVITSSRLRDHFFPTA
jgi:dCMP deaminase